MWLRSCYIRSVFNLGQSKRETSKWCFGGLCEGRVMEYTFHKIGEDSCSPTVRAQSWAKVSIDE